MKNDIINSQFLKENNITTVNKFPATAILIIAIALVLGVYSLLINSESSTSMPITAIAVVLLLIGIAKLFFTGKNFKYVPTKEVLEEDVIYFEISQRDMVEKALANGEFRKLKELARSNSTLSLMVELYSSNSESVAIYRLHEYVPHNYQPLGDYMFYKK